jgi:DNA mismatch repair protein MutS
VFLHAVEEGPASQSYGIQVAQLAGIPASVVKAARKRLAFLEAQAASAQVQGDLFASPAPVDPTPEPTEHPALVQLRDADPDSLTPREALDLLYALKKLTG